jgi:fermentation-respiration switch protein FrsA (DUF1100 family)
MMRKLLLLVTLLFTLPQVYAQAEPTAYRAALNKFMLYYNRNQADSIFTMFAPDVKTQIPVEKNRQQVTLLQNQLGRMQRAAFMGLQDGVAMYRADFQKSSLAMKVSLNSRGKMSGLLFDNYKAETEAPVLADDPYTTETPFDLKTLSGTIRGTLATPKQASGKVPVVLIIAASGPTDRDGNKPKVNQTTNMYRMLAAGLAKSGIASLRYDKRLVGETINKSRESQLKFDDYVDDATALINQLHEDSRFSKIIILGHSEGSLVGMLAVAGQPVNGFISVEGESQTADKLITEQLKGQPDYITQGFKAIADSLRRGRTNDKVDPSLYGIARVSVQPYLMTWMRFDPTREIKKLKLPILLIQGANDLQVSIADAERLKKAKSDAKLTVIQGMNYVLKDAPQAAQANMATYNQPELPVKPELVTAISDFVKGLK